nr:MAG TPA: hypothetical protein [Caudoviricetes sp.]
MADTPGIINTSYIKSTMTVIIIIYHRCKKYRRGNLPLLYSG